MRQFCRWLKRNKRTRELLLEGITLPEVQVQPNRRDRLQPNEADALVRQAFKSKKVYRGYPGERRGWLYRLALLTGLRKSELATLTPASFRVAKKVVVVPAGRTKNGKEAHCPLPTAVFPALSPWLRKHGPNQPLFPDLAKVSTNDLVFYDLRDAGIPYETPDGVRCFHALRNSFISSLWDRGLPGPLVQGLARHSTMELTTRYNRHRDGARAAAVEGLPVPGMYRGEYRRRKS
jgi:integrase